MVKRAANVLFAWVSHDSSCKIPFLILVCQVEITSCCDCPSWSRDVVANPGMKIANVIVVMKFEVMK